MATEIIEVFATPTEVVEVLTAGPIGLTGPQANINYTVVSSSQTITNRQLIAADTSGGSFTLTLPLNPEAGDAVDIFDYANTFDTNPLTIGRNGENIESLAENLTANVEGAYFTLIYTGSTRGWQVLPRYGVSGIEDVLSTQGDLLYRGASSETRLPIGTAGQVLKVNSGATAPEWGSISGSISVTGSDLTLSGATGTAITNATIANDAVTNAKLANVASQSIKGRATSTTGDPEDLTASQVRSILNVADGAEVNVQSNWTEANSGSDAFILNKPTLGTAAAAATTDFATAVHTHGNITNAGLVGTISGLPLKTGTGGIVEAGAFGTSAGQFAEGNHTHASADITSGVLDNARVNFAAPAAIGNTTPAAGTFTTLNANNTVTLTGRFNQTANINCLSGTLSFGNGTQFIGGYDGSPDRAFFFSGTITSGSVSARKPMLFDSSVLSLSNDGVALAYLNVDGSNILAERNGTNAQTFNIYNTFTSATNHERGFLKWSSNVFQIGTEAGSGGGSNRDIIFTTSGATRMTIAATGGSIRMPTFAMDNSGCQLASTVAVRWSGGSIGGGSDLFLFRDAAGILGQRNSTNAQTFRIYNTFTATDNFERGFMRWSSNVFQIGTEKGSAGGTARALELQTDGVTRMTVGATGTVSINTVGSGNNTLQVDNSGVLGNGRLVVGAGGSHSQQLTIDPRGGGVCRISATGTDTNIAVQTGGFTRLTIGVGGGVTIADANNIAVGTTTGTKIGTATTQKIGFFNATPVVQQTLTTDLLDSIQALGLVASGSGDTPLNLSGGTLTAGNLVLTDNTGAETATFDAQAKLTENRTYDLPDRSGTIVVSDTSAGSGSDVVNNIVSLTQAEYNAIGSPDAATLFLITDP